MPGPDISPVAQTLGFQILETGEGRCKARFPVREEFKRSPGEVVQGGFLAAMLDSTMALAIITVLDPGQTHYSIELKANYFRPATEGWLVAEAKVIRKGRRTVYAEATLSTEANQQVARASTTSLIEPQE
jgi:uncharacterized protein (TIGR00369 family)